MGPPKQGKALGRRRACDFCCRKKIKCDAKSPKCSNCHINNVKCLWTPGVSANKSGVSKRPLQEPVRSDEDAPLWLSALEHRLVAVESMLGGNMLPWSATTPTGLDTRVASALTPSSNASMEKAATPLAGADPAATTHGPVLGTPFNELDLWMPLISNPPDNGDGSAHQQPELRLPPIEVSFPIIKRYFETSNQGLPIFYEPTFYTMFIDWYRADEPSSSSSLAGPPRQNRDPATWAVLNAAIALSLRQTAAQCTATSEEEEDRLARECISNAQSVIDTLVTRDEDFKGLQTLLCLSLVFMASAAPKPACILIAMAVKLVHRLRAHTKEGKEKLDAAAALQRDRLFWVTYILDRDLSMRSIEPYIQQDREQDVDLPEAGIPADGVGVLTGPDGVLKLNIFHFRVQLALIQGALHDTVHSVRGRGMPREGKEAASVKLGLTLWEWRCSLPDGFRPEDIKGWVERTGSVPRVLLQLHLTFYLCFFMSFRLHARDRNWMRQLMEFSKRYADGEDGRDEQAQGSDVSGRTIDEQELELLPAHWEAFVKAARASLDLARLIDDADTALIWSSTCLHHAALMVLIANNLTVSQHHKHLDMESDMRLIDEGIDTLDARHGECTLLLKERGAAAELNKRSKRAVKEYSEGLLTAVY